MKRVQTLQGFFPPEREPAKRNFILENKLKLKDLQKQVINKRQILCEIEESRKGNIRRGQSQQGQFGKQKSLDKINIYQQKRSISCGSAKRIDSACSTCGTDISTGRNRQFNDNQIKRSGSRLSIDQAIQTDEIIDIEFLNQQLKRCSARGKFPLNSIDPNLVGLSHPQQDKDFQKFEENDVYTNVNGIPHNIRPRNDQPHHELPNLDKLELNFQNLDIDNDNLYAINQSSVRKKFSKPHNSAVSGSVKLPKYLEREKRQLELQQLRDKEIDPNCPEGFHLLTEKERLLSLENKEKEFRELVDELNRMPLTSATLRVKNRKNEIEKALLEVEIDIQKLSKLKVYIKN